MEFQRNFVSVANKITDKIRKDSVKIHRAAKQVMDFSYLYLIVASSGVGDGGLGEGVGNDFAIQVLTPFPIKKEIKNILK